jgi:glycosyltransferase involved in cell wall biosynthesis
MPTWRCSDWTSSWACVRAKSLLRPVAAAYARRWSPGSRLFLVGEDARWSVDHDLFELGRLATRLGVHVADTRFLTVSRRQAAFFGSQFTLLREPWRHFPHALGTAYFHGRPGTPGMPEFDIAYKALCSHHSELARIQVTHAEMQELVLSSEIDPAKVFRIPIGVDIELFTPQTPRSRTAARRAFGLPAQAFVVGSFQKDGVGWGAGDEPKLIKGPDVLVEALRVLRARRPELHVLLSGPARGYVRASLERLGIPYVHRLLDRYEEVAQLYAALDAYVVPSRQEGGPKGVLEAMASGIPVVSTRVGQAAELIRDGENGRLVDVDDAEALAERLAIIDGTTVAAGIETARANAYEKQEPLWHAFFDGFVAHA